MRARKAAHMRGMDPIYRHVAACNNAVLPGGRVPITIGGQGVGLVGPHLVPALRAGGASWSFGVLGMEQESLDRAATMLARAGQFRWRDEAFDVRARPDGPVLATVDRGALPTLGIAAVGVHLNGLVRRADGFWLWVARRAADKLLDPGKLDHLVGGGVPAGLTPLEALVKEGEEEAGVEADLMAGAVHVATIDYAMARDEGLRRDRLECWDLVLPEGFVPEARDGEVESFELWPLRRALEAVRGSEDFKFNVNLVLIDLFRRHGLLPPETHDIPGHF